MGRLAYGNKRMSMIFVVPDDGTSLDTVLSKLNATSLNANVAQMQSLKGNVTLPRFTAAYGVKLNDTLSALGMKDAFDANLADFSNMAQNVYMQFVYHKTFVKVNEEGTEAAAVSAGGGSANSVEPELRVTKPFFYAIRDDKTGVLLFLGKLMNPAAATD